MPEYGGSEIELLGLIGVQMAETDFLNKSVTAGDQGSVQGGVISLVIPQTWTYSNNMPLPPQPPPYWTRQRDEVLRSTVYNEAMWAAAVYIAITKIASKSWRIDSTSDRRARQFQELYLMADGQQIGWVQFLSKHLADYLCVDNGAFTEIIRERKSIGSKIVGLRHLDAMRVTRTGDPAIPALYRDRRNRIHELKAHQVMMFSDMPDPGEMYYGVGRSAAGRSYNAIYKLAAIEWYLREKVAGLSPLALYIVNGLVQAQIEGAVRAAKEQTVAKGLAAYMGAVIIGVPSDKPPEVATIPLAELPDRFERKQEFDLSILTYADNIGLDPQDLQPLSGQGFGTGAQSIVLAEKSSGRGLASWQQQWTHQNNTLVLPDFTTWVWFEKDLRDMAAQADYEGKRIGNMKSAIEGGIVMPEQAVQVLVDQDILPKEFLPKDETAGGSMADDEKMTQTPEPAETLEEEAAPEVDAGDQATAEELADVPEVSEEKELAELPLAKAKRLIEGVKRKREAGVKFARAERKQKLKHLAGEHSQKVHGNRGLPVTKDPFDDYLPRNREGYNAKDSFYQAVEAIGMTHPEGLLAMNYTDPDTGMIAKIDSIAGYLPGQRVPPVAKASVAVEGRIFDKDGNMVGQFSRSYFKSKEHGDNLIADHDVFSLDEAYQGNGFGGRFYRRTEKAYEAMNISGIVLFADLTVGAYAWARAGFNASPRRIEGIRAKAMELWHANPANGPFPKGIENMWEIAGLKTPDGARFGRDLLLHGDNGKSLFWDGWKSLDPASAGYQAGDAYFRSKGK